MTLFGKTTLTSLLADLNNKIVELQAFQKDTDELVAANEATITELQTENTNFRADSEKAVRVATKLKELIS